MILAIIIFFLVGYFTGRMNPHFEKTGGDWFFVYKINKIIQKIKVL